MDFEILNTSTNLDLLGLAPVLTSRVTYAPAEITARLGLPTTGRLLKPVTLALSKDGGATHEDVVITTAAAEDNITALDLVRDVNAALLASAGFKDVSARLDINDCLVLSATGLNSGLFRPNPRTLICWLARRLGDHGTTVRIHPYCR